MGAAEPLRHDAHPELETTLDCIASPGSSTRASASGSNAKAMMCAQFAIAAHIGQCSIAAIMIDCTMIDVAM